MEDKKIIELFFQRSEEAISECSIKYGNYCRKIARDILKSEEDALESENDTYLRAWDSIPPTEPLSLKAYLGKIVRNIAIQKYRYLHAQKRNQNVECVIEELEQCVASLESVEENIVAEELASYINQFLESLNASGRDLFVRRYWRMDSIKQISLDTGMRKGNIETSLYRSRQKLKVYLEEKGYRV